MQPSVYLAYCEDAIISSLADGSVQTIVVTPQRYWGLGLNLAECVVGLRIKGLPTNGGVTIKAQFSLDGKNWLTGDTVIPEKTVDGDFTGAHSNNLQLMPFYRFVIAIRDTTVAPTQKTASVSVWGYYKFRC